jgi:5-hydroxyisourate hydrolase-like protein (transthyretin family)
LGTAFRFSFFAFRILCWLALAALPAAAGTLTGVVRNLTTGQAAPGQNVVLMDMQAGMDVLATARTDAQGRYRLEHATIGRGPVLVRVQYQGVNYHTNVQPGRETADVEIFEATSNAAVMTIATRMVVVQPNGPVLLVGEEFTIHNHSEPKKAYFRPDGTFEFVLPDGATLGQVSAWGPSGLPLVQGAIAKGGNRQAIAFPIRPGDNGVRLSYEMSYAENRATLRLSSPYALTRMVLIAPPQLQISGGGFAPAGMEQGWNLYAREAVAAGSTVEFGVSGTAPPPAPEPQPAAAGASAATAPPGAQIQVMPGRLDNLKWILIGGFGALFVLGVIFLWRRPVPQMAGAPAGAGNPAHARAVPAAATRHQSPVTSQDSPAGMEQVDRDVRISLDELKEKLFRLELRRQAGTISEDEYSRERSRTEEVLRELLKG